MQQSDLHTSTTPVSTLFHPILTFNAKNYTICHDPNIHTFPETNYSDLSTNVPPSLFTNKHYARYSRGILQSSELFRSLDINTSKSLSTSTDLTQPSFI